MHPVCHPLVRLVRIGLTAVLLVVLAGSAGATPPDDSDGDGRPDPCDRCSAIPFASQKDVDGDDIGDVCDGDFDQNDRVDIDDFNRFLVDFQAGADADEDGTDMTGDGAVGIADFNLFLEQFQQGTPGPGRTDPDVTGACFDHRFLKDLTYPTSDGCSATAQELYDLWGTLYPIHYPRFPLDGDVNNPTDTIVGLMSGNRCPNAAFGSFVKRDGKADRCAIDIDVSVCGGANAGMQCIHKWCARENKDSQECTLDADCAVDETCYAGWCNPTNRTPCTSNADCDSPYVCKDVNCGEREATTACGRHDACGNTCGYRKFECDDEFRTQLHATCYALQGPERSDCLTVCLDMADIYALAKDPIGQNDDGTWTADDLVKQEENCLCCDGTTSCGDGVCEPDRESCLEGSCPEDCGTCGPGDPCIADRDCDGGACFEGRCGTWPADTPCSDDSQCTSGDCGLLGVCQASCGDGLCDGPELCGALDALTCNSDCGTCPDGNVCGIDADCSSDACNFGLCVAPGSLDPPTPCTTNNACSTGVCNLGLCSNGGLPVGTPCSTDGACSSGSCSGVCTAACSNGLCETGEKCGDVDSGLECTSDCGLCRDGEICIADDDCQSGLCGGGFCLATGLPNGSVCVDSGQCDSGLCNGGICLPQGSVPDGGVCTSNDACQSGICNAGLCLGSPLGAGAVCTTDLACVSGDCNGFCVQRCGDGRCDGTEICGGSNSGLECNSDCGKCGNGTPCTSSSDCASGFCAGVCANPPSCKSNGTSCSAETECCSGRCDGTGSGRTCRACKGSGGSCNELNDCCSFVCNFLTDRCL